jgi:hypothetical protein
MHFTFSALYIAHRCRPPIKRLLSAAALAIIVGAADGGR